MLMTLLSVGIVLAKTSKEHTEIYSNIKSPIIKQDLNAMTDDEIKDYFNDCIARDLVFFYKGGIVNSYLADDTDINLAQKFRFVSLGCTGGCEEGYKFNKLMLNYVKENPELLSTSETDFIDKPIIPKQINSEFKTETIFRVDFQSGFKNEKVVLYINDEQALSGQLTSPPDTALAKSIELTTKENAVNLMIILPNKKQRWHCTVDLSKGSYIGISLEEEQVLVIQSTILMLYD